MPPASATKIRARRGRPLVPAEALHPAVVVVPHRCLHRADPAEIVSLENLADRHALRVRWRRREIGDARDHHRLLLLGLEPRGPQPFREIGREVVAVQLPLEPLAPVGEERDLPCDQCVELGAVKAAEVAVGDPALVTETRGAEDGAVPLGQNAGRFRIVDVRTALRVVGAQECGGVAHPVVVPDETRATARTAPPATNATASSKRATSISSPRSIGCR